MGSRLELDSCVRLQGLGSDGLCTAKAPVTRRERSQDPAHHAEVTLKAGVKDCNEGNARLTDRRRKGHEEHYDSYGMEGLRDPYALMEALMMSAPFSATAYVVAMIFLSWSAYSPGQTVGSTYPDT